MSSTESGEVTTSLTDASTMLSIVSSPTSTPTSTVLRTSSATAIEVLYNTRSTIDGRYQSIPLEAMTGISATAPPMAFGTADNDRSTMVTSLPPTLDQHPLRLQVWKVRDSTYQVIVL